MNRDDILRMAREAHHELVTKDYPGHMGKLDPWTMRLLERFANLVAAAERDANLQQIEIIVEAAVAAEREACIEDCEALGDSWRQGYLDGVKSCIAVIRARGEK